MIESFRTALLITLSILVVVILVRRFKQYVRMHHMPVPQEARLIEVQVLYHPVRLRVALHMPKAAEVRPAILSDGHVPLRQWPPVQVPQGEQVLELPMEPGREGLFYFEVATDTQRTERRFMVRQG